MWKILDNGVKHQSWVGKLLLTHALLGKIRGLANPPCSAPVCLLSGNCSQYNFIGEPPKEPFLCDGLGDFDSTPALERFLIKQSKWICPIPLLTNQNQCNMMEAFAVAVGGKNISSLLQ